MLTLNIYRNLLLILLPLSFLGCDKKGNPLPSNYNFKCEINGIKYKDQGPMFLSTPGARPSPVISVEEKYIQFSTTVGEENAAVNKNRYSILLNIPNEIGIPLNQAIPFKPIEGKEILEGDDNVFYLQGIKQFARIYSMNNLDRQSYGTGTVTFSKYDLAGASAAGRLEITFPNTDLDAKEKELKVVGNFECWIDK